MRNCCIMLLAVITVLATVSGCSLPGSTKIVASSSAPPMPAASSSDKIPLTILVDELTQKGLEDEAVLAEIENRLLLERGINVKLNMIGTEHTQAFQTINMKLAANELDAFSMALDYSVSQFLTKEMTLPLDDLLRDYPHLTAQIMADAWPQVTYHGKRLLIPVKSPVDIRHVPWIRKDLLDQVGLPVPTTLDEFGTAVRKILDTDSNLLGMTSDFIGRVFTVSFGSGYTSPPLDKQGNLIPTIQTHLGGSIQPTSAYWRSWMVKMQQFYKEGVINNEIFTIKGDRFPDLINSGRLVAIATDYGFQKEADRLAGLEPGNPLPVNAKKQVWVMCPLTDEGRPLTWSFGKSQAAFIGISRNSKHPKEVLTVLDWLAENIDHSVLAKFGIEGKQYTVKDGIIVPKASVGGVPIYSGSLHKMALGFFGKELELKSHAFIGTEWKKVFDPAFPHFQVYDNDILYKFEKSKAFLPNIEELAMEFFIKAVTGQIPVDDRTVQALMDNMKNAGLQIYMDEMNEQYHEASSAQNQ